MSLKVDVIPSLKDNYIFVLNSGSQFAIVDPGEVKPVVDHFSSLINRRPQFIFNTHHHEDHTAANLELKDLYRLEIYSSKYDKDRIPGVDKTLKSGDKIIFGDTHCQVLEIPGHTLGHIAYHFPLEKILFCGDTLFSLGCGRLFEGSPQQMLESLKLIKSLDDETLVYCTHEYTQTNAAFAITVDPTNSNLKAYIKKVNSKRQNGQPSIPTVLLTEKKCNPFLRCDTPSLLDRFQLTSDDELLCFTQLRSLRNHY